MNVALHRIVFLLYAGVTAPAIATKQPHTPAVSASSPGPAVLYCNGDTDGSNGYTNREYPHAPLATLFDDFIVPEGSVWTLQGLRHRAIWRSGPIGQGTGMEIYLVEGDNGPDNYLMQLNVTSYEEQPTGRVMFSRDEYEAFTLFDEVTLGPGHYWFDAHVLGPEDNYWLVREAVSNNECWVYFGPAAANDVVPGSSWFGVAADLNWTLLGEGSGLPGACCLAEAICIDDMTSCDCAAVEGGFRGPGTACMNLVCRPRGACCFPLGACDDIFDRDTCEISGGVFYGAGRACEGVSCPTCDGDIDRNGSVDFGDLLAILSAWGNSGGAEDITRDGIVDFADILLLLSLWGDCP